MDRAEFDKFADEYEQQHAQNVRLSGEAPEFFARYKVEHVAKALAPWQPARVLDFGGGIGNSVPHLGSLLRPRELTCLDVSERSLAIARQRFPGQANFVAFDGNRIPAEDQSFDLVFTACVFHHIEPALRPLVLAELHRVLAPGGWLFLFEHNPRNPLTRRAVETCPFDIDAQLIRADDMAELVAHSGYGRVAIDYLLFFPHILRALRRWEYLLRALPLGAQYVVAGRR